MQDFVCGGSDPCKGFPQPLSSALLGARPPAVVPGPHTPTTVPPQARALPDLRPHGARPCLAAQRSLSSPRAALAVLPSPSRSSRRSWTSGCPAPAPCAPLVRVHLLPGRSRPRLGPRYLPDPGSSALCSPTAFLTGSLPTIPVRTTPAPPTAFPMRTARRPQHPCDSITLCHGACIPTGLLVPTPQPLLPLGGCVLTFWPRLLCPSLPRTFQECRDQPLLSAGWAPLGDSVGSLPQGPAVVCATLTGSLEAFHLQAGLRILALIRMD